jgi:gluconolactonase
MGRVSCGHVRSVEPERWPLLPDDPIVTNICFGGPDRRTAYITLSGTGQLVAMDWPEPELPLAFSR